MIPDINSMYPTMPNIDRYKMLVNGMFGGFSAIEQEIERRRLDELLCKDVYITEELWKEVNEMSEPYMNRYNREDTDRDIHFLFETDNWNGKAIKDMTSSHIINSALMLLKRATEFKLNYELFVIDNSNNKLLTPKDNIDELAKLDATTWVKTTPIYVAFMKELAVRKLLSYFEIVLTRMETEKGTED